MGIIPVEYLLQLIFIWCDVTSRKTLSKYINMVLSANNINIPCIFNSEMVFTYVGNKPDFFENRINPSKWKNHVNNWWGLEWNNFIKNAQTYFFAREYMKSEKTRMALGRLNMVDDFYLLFYYLWTNSNSETVRQKLPFKDRLII